MDFKQLFDDNRAVSPVIGVILMVAITVILAAVIGTFVLGLGDQVQSTSPQASFGFDQSTETIDGGEFTAVTVTHESGDSIDAADISLSVNGETAYGVGSSDSVVSLYDSGKISAGSSATIVASTNVDDADAGAYNNSAGTLNIDSGATASDVGLSEGDTVRVIYNSPDSDSSSTLGKKEVQ